MNAVRPATTESELPVAPWPRVKLGETCEFSADGDWIESKDQALSGIRLIQTGNIGNGRFENKAEKSRFVSEDTFSRLHCTVIFPGDVLVSRLPDPVGRACKLSDIGQRMITAVDCTILRFKDVVDSDFFILYSQSPDYRLQIESFITGSTRARISRKNLEQISIPLPPLSVQRSIVARLDAELARADRMRERFLALAESAAARFRAILAETFEQGEPGDSGEGGVSRRSGASGSSGVSGFPWPRVRLDKVCDLCLGKMLDSAKNHGNLHSYLRNVNVRWGSFDLSDLREMRAEKQDLPRYSAIPGDLVVCEGGEPGRCAIWRGESPILLQKALHRVRPGKEVSAEYLYHLFSLYSQNGTFADKFSGTTIKHLTGEALASVEIPLPPLSVQRSIVARLDAARAECDRIGELARKGAEGCAALRAALLKEAFE